MNPGAYQRHSADCQTNCFGNPCKGASDGGYADYFEAAMTITELVKQSYDIAEAHGFWKDADSVPLKYLISTKLALVHSEVSEALEEVRDSDDLVKLREIRYTEGKLEGFGPELADIVIRVADLAGKLGIDLESVIIEKLAYNRGRPYLHGRTI
jgi:NTP pyrophosphatase (non-canonical NTP hydrolase)